MFSAIASGAIFGINSYVTQIEVDTSESLPGFDMVGYLSSEVRESKERVKAAIKNSNFFFSNKFYIAIRSSIS